MLKSRTYILGLQSLNTTALTSLPRRPPIRYVAHCTARLKCVRSSIKGSCHGNHSPAGPDIGLRALSTTQHLRALSKTKPLSEEDPASSKLQDGASITKVEGQTYPKPDFTNHKEVYKTKTTKELYRAFLVFSMCSVDVLVNHHVKLLGWVRRWLGQGVFRRLMKATMYGQFMAGEKAEEVLGVSKRLASAGLYPMFAYTAGEVHGSASDSGASGAAERVWRRNYQALQDAIEMAASAKEFAPITPQLSTKVTFLADADLLQRVSIVISHNEDICFEAFGGKVEPHQVALSGEWCNSLAKMLQDSSWPGFDGPAAMTTKLQQSSLLCSLLTHIPFHLNAQQTKDLPLKGVSEEDREALLKLWIMMKDLGQRAKDHGINLIWDAEQTYLQPAIEALILDSQRLFNKERTVITNTYQCYLKRTYGIVSRDLAMARAEGLWFGGKVVRGAYMDEERRLAKDHGYEDPVNPDYEATTAMYYRVTDLLLDNLREQEVNKSQKVTGLQVTFATHNSDTVTNALQGIEKRKMTIGDGMIRFAQLYGMRDPISFALGQSGYPAAKLLHFGDIEEGVAYLSRRAQENRSGIPTAGLERRMLQAELSRRHREKS